MAGKHFAPHLACLADCDNTPRFDASSYDDSSLARKKAAHDFEHNAHWLVNLAIVLAEKNREPNGDEKFKLRIRRLDNRLISGGQTAATARFIARVRN
jgi:hypothetical protein